MTQPHDPWTILAERGEWRGADEIANRALDELDRRAIGQHSAIGTQPEEGPTALSPTTPVRRRLPGLLVAAIAFVVVMIAFSATWLIPRIGSDIAPGTDEVTSTDSSDPATSDVSTDVLPTDDAAPTEFVIPPDFVTTDAWPSPVLDPVLNLQLCPTRPESPGWFLPDSFFAFLGLDRQAVNLAAVDPRQVAVSTPMLRAGGTSMLSTGAIEGGCLLTVSDGTVTGWAIYLANGKPAMMALSLPWPDNSVPDRVSNAAGNYQQWRIATGELFTGRVTDEGQVHVMANQRLYVATFDPLLVPDNGNAGSWLMASLAVSPPDTTRLLDWPLFDGSSGADVVVPVALPPGFGLCAAVDNFYLSDIPDDSVRQSMKVVLCDPSGSEVVITAGLLPAAPAEATSVDINGHEMSEWSATDRHMLQFSRSGMDVLVEAPTTLEPANLRGLVAAMPLASRFVPPVTARILIGVGDGIDSSLLSPDPLGEEGVLGFSSPARDDFAEDVSLFEMIARAGTSGVEVTMSDSMRTIMSEGLDSLDATPFLYQYKEGGGVVWENGYFDVPSLNLYLSIGQQTLPIEWRQSNPIALVEETSGAWQVGFKADSDGDGFQIVAYSPSIEREVNILFGPRSRDAEGFPDPLRITADEARRLAQNILDTIAIPS
jgi:hypothetical protein